MLDISNMVAYIDTVFLVFLENIVNESTVGYERIHEFYIKNKKFP